MNMIDLKTKLSKQKYQNKTIGAKEKKTQNFQMQRNWKFGIKIDFLYHANTSYRSTIIEIEIYTMQTHLTVPLSSLSSWMPYASP